MAKRSQEGDTLTVVAPYALTSGDGCLVGSLFGVANTTVASGANVEITLEGVFPITALSTDTATVGAKAYWDNTAKKITTTLTANSLVGVFAYVKIAAETVSLVYLDGAIR